MQLCMIGVKLVFLPFFHRVELMTINEDTSIKSFYALLTEVLKY